MLTFFKSLFCRKVLLRTAVIPDLAKAKKVRCKISTPQFNANGYTMFSQRGMFFKDVMRFYPDSKLHGHRVQFKNISEFKSSCAEVYEVIF